MKLDRALQQAQAVTGEKSAARLYNDIDYELALGDYTQDEAGQGEAALAWLEENFPGVRGQARDIETPPRLSHKASTAANPPEPRPAPPLTAGPRTAPAARPRSARARAGRATAIHARPRRRGSGGAFGSRAGRASESVGRAVIHGVEGIVGLVLLGLLVSPRGSQAITASSSLLTRLLGRVANPTSDPLAGLSHGGGGTGGHDVPIVPRLSKKKPPPAPPGSRYRVPRPVPFPPIPVRPPVTGSPWGTLSPGGGGIPDPIEVP